MAAYSKKFETGTSNSAELQALISDITLCKDLNFYNILIESHSELIVECTQKNLCSSQYLWEFWERLEKVI